MSLTTSGPEIPLSSPKCVTTSSSKTLSNNNNSKNIVVDDHIDNDYRNDITMKTSEAEKQGEKMGFPSKNFIETKFMLYVYFFF